MTDKRMIIKGLENWMNNFKDNPLYLDFSAVVELHRVLKEQPDIVRCKDCKFGYCLNPSCDVENRYFQCLSPFCGGMKISHKADWFCADGVKKDD